MSEGGDGSTAGSGELTKAGWERRGFASHCRFIEAFAAGSTGGQLIEGPGLRASIAPACGERSLFNSVAYEDPAVLEQVYPELENAYREAGVGAWTVWVPEADRTSAALLESAGHRFDGSPQAMRIELGAVGSGGDGDDEISVSGRGDWRQLCAINDTAYDHRPGTFLAGLGTSGADFRVYSASLDGRVAAGLATTPDVDGDCGITLVATLPEARGRGLASRLMLRALTDARERGCTTSTLIASAAGRPVYGRLGYHEFGAIEMWERRRPAD